jgi:glycosyltransferase involved in cell wall biosynthesis
MLKPRILIIENSVAITGALKSIVRSSQGLRDKYEFLFVVPTDSEALNVVQYESFIGFELEMKELRKNVFSLITYLPVLISNAFKMSRIVKDNKIDLIVVNDFYNLLPVLYKMIGGKQPYICYVRFLPSKFPKSLVKSWCALHNHYAHTTIAVSEAVKNELPQSNVVVIGNELPPEEIEFTPSVQSTTILYPANYIQGKGHQFALESFALISKKHPHWKLKFVGGDMGLKKNKDFKANLIAHAKKLNLDTQVEWCNFAEKMSDEYLNAALVLNFSESESFSMTCLEAMYYGRPVIATRSGGPQEIIDHDDTGILVEVRDVTAMAKAIDHLLDNPNIRQRMAKHAYNRVREKFSFQNTMGRLGDVYKKALENSY